MVKAWNAMSRYFSHRRMMSFFRSSGSPPVKVRLCLWPYSAAQQPVQCILQAEVGSIRISHGTLMSYFPAVSCAV